MYINLGLHLTICTTLYNWPYPLSSDGSLELALYKNCVCMVDCNVYKGELVYILCTAKQSYSTHKCTEYMEREGGTHA